MILKFILAHKERNSKEFRDSWQEKENIQPAFQLFFISDLISTSTRWISLAMQ